MISGRVKSRKDRLLERLRRYYVCLSILRSYRILLNIGRRLRNKGRANLLTAISKYSIYIGYRTDSRYKDFKVCNYYRIRISLARL